MRAFLSHSSLNKTFVKKVFSGLGASIAEFDEATFTAGMFNVEAINSALSKTQIFVLFATPESLRSGYVDIEIKIAQERYAQRKILRIVTICLDGTGPQDLPDFLRSISAVQKLSTPGAVERFIRSELVQVATDAGKPPRPFVGRDALKKSITDRLSDPERRTPVAIALSGVDGVGRRTLARKIFQDIYPHLGTIHPFIHLVKGSGLEDIYRDLFSLEGGSSKIELLQSIRDFAEMDPDQRVQAVASKISDFTRQNQVLFAVDDGGLLDSDGSINEDLKKVILSIGEGQRHHPPLCLILYRTPPGKSREKNDVLYFRVDSLEQSEVKKLVSLHIKRRGETASSSQIDALVELVDGHPYNLEFLLDLLDSVSIDSIISDPADLISFKKRQGDDFFSKINLDEGAVKILSALRVLGPSSIEILAQIEEIDSSALSLHLRKLEDYHCVERMGELVTINRALRAAIERSSTLRLTPGQVKKIQKAVVSIFHAVTDSDVVPVALISGAARAAVMLNSDDTTLSIFMSPANSILAAKQLYDAKRYEDCVKTCARALNQLSFITDEARVEAVRLQALCLARLGKEEPFQKSISLLREDKPREKALRFFLQGFKKRIAGYPIEASELFKKSLEINPTSFSALREMSHALLVQGLHEDAKSYSDGAMAIAPTNPFVIDQALAIAINRTGKIDEMIFFNPVIEDLLERLEAYGDEEGKSFFAIRKADIYRRIGDDSKALENLDRAIRLNPSHVPAYVMQCEVLLKGGAEISTVNKKISELERLIHDESSGEGKTNLPDLINLKVSLLIEEGKLHDAVDRLRKSQARLGAKVGDLKRRISFEAARNSSQLDSEDRAFLKSA